MSAGENKLIRRRLAGAWLSSVISISLVLLLVGVASLLLVNAKSVSDYFKENMQVSVLMKQEVTENEAMDFTTVLDAKPYIKSTRFISKEEGPRDMKELLGDDFLSVFETAPIPVSVEVTLMADYVSGDSLAVVNADISESPLVEEVVYQQSLVDKLNTNLKKISLVLGVFIVLLLFISFVLINNTVRINVFSRRFTIHTMQLVGATRRFIRRPFMKGALMQGLVSSFLALAVLAGVLALLRNSFGQLFSVFDLRSLLIVAGAVVVCGVLICLISTYFVVNKLVALGKDQLYY